MFKKKVERKIQKIVQEFFEKTSFEVRVDVGEIEESTIPVLLTMEEPQVLIGENGKTLFCVQHLLSKILKRQFKDKEEFYIDLDINDYKKKKLNYLKELARSYADDVAFSKEEKELRPMSAYERRIIHLELKDRSDVRTESVGQEPERKIIIKPA
jgi:spoIIIJ-associated protein